MMNFHKKAGCPDVAAQFIAPPHQDGISNFIC